MDFLLSSLPSATLSSQEEELFTLRRHTESTRLCPFPAKLRAEQTQMWLLKINTMDWSSAAVIIRNYPRIVAECIGR
jgi:hypothetical protein